MYALYRKPDFQECMVFLYLDMEGGRLLPGRQISHVHTGMKISVPDRVELDFMSSVSMNDAGLKVLAKKHTSSDADRWVVLPIWNANVEPVFVPAMQQLALVSSGLALQNGAGNSTK